MSIQLTQAFEFETDDIKNFEKMLGTIIPILFHHKPSDYVRHSIDTNEPEFWDDGSRFQHSHCVVQDGNVFAIAKRTEFYHGSAFHAVQMTTDDKDQAADFAYKKNKPIKATRKFICSLEDYKRDGSSVGKAMQDLPGVDQKYCKDNAEMKKATMALVKSIDKDVIHGLYTIDFDGSIGLGYRMQWTPNGGWNKLIVSATPIYYGK